MVRKSDLCTHGNKPRTGLTLDPPGLRARRADPRPTSGFWHDGGGCGHGGPWFIGCGIDPGCVETTRRQLVELAARH